jgi:hypothetical protein
MTVEVGEEQADEVEKVMLESAEILNGGLTRSVWEPLPDQPGYYRQKSRKRLRQRGRLA